MVIHPDFPDSPYAILDLDIRWFPADEALREKGADKLMPPLVDQQGREELDLPQKMQRLHQWCEDVNAMQSEVEYDFVYVDQKSFEKYKLKSFSDLLAGFTEYKT